MKKLIFLLALSFLLPFSLSANKLQLTDLQPQGNKLELKISWENSWKLERAPFNHDAVWLFAKYQNAQGEWLPIDLSTSIADHGTGDSLLMIETVTDGKGVFVKRRKEGEGNIPSISLSLQMAHMPAQAQAIKVFGIEMVYIPEGPFWIGDSLQANSFRRGDGAGPFRITSEAMIPVGTAAGQLYNGGDFPPEADIPATYPKGYAAFYLMKYELTQEQYVDFLNCLSFGQQLEHTRISPASQAGRHALAVSSSNPQRNGIIIGSPGNAGGPPASYACEGAQDGIFFAADDGQNRACNFLEWSDLAAYLDWAALRPITELEYEKACRGPEYPLPGGFAWGTDQAIDANTVINDGRASESVSEQATAQAGLASHGYAGPQGPLRVGFGGSAASDRLQIGGSYYGVLELSGNLWELCVNVEATGLAFEGQPGDGQLSAFGLADEAFWPVSDGVGHRGGALNSGITGPFRDLAISDRFYAGLFPSVRRNTGGGRGGR